MKNLRHRFSDLGLSSSGRHAVLLEPSRAAIWVFDLEARGCEPRLTDPNATSVAMGTAPSVVATAGQDGVRVWNATTGALLRDWRTPGRVALDVAISSDERWVATGTKDGMVLIWDLATGDLRARIAAHLERAAAIAFSQDAQLLASGGWDGRVRLFDLRQLDLAAAEIQAEVERAWGLDLAQVLESNDDLWRRPTP